MHMHNTYTLNSNRRGKKLLFQINVIPITALSPPPENLISTPAELNTMTSASKAPWTFLVMPVCLPGELFVLLTNIDWNLALARHCAMQCMPLSERSNWVLVWGPQPLSLCFQESLVIRWDVRCLLHQTALRLRSGILSRSSAYWLLAPCQSVGTQWVLMNEFVNEWW